MELWTAAHFRTVLPALAVMVAVAAVLRVTIGKKPWEIRMIPMKILAAIIVLLEIGKQVLSFRRGYDLYHIPLHFCSLFIFMLPAFAFYRGRGCRTVAGITAGLCAAVLALMLIYPNLIYGAWDIENYFTDFMALHTVTFHNIVMFAFILILALELHEPQARGESRAVVWFMVGFCAVAATMAQLLQTNFANFYSCNIPVFAALCDAIRPTLGNGLTQLIYVLAVAVLHVLFTLGAYWAYRGLRKALTVKKTVTV